MSIQILGTLVKPCKGNRLSSWTFFNDNETYYATNDLGKRINCSGVQDARNFYSKMRSYGFYQPETTTEMINVTPVIHSNFVRMPNARTGSLAMA